MAPARPLLAAAALIAVLANPAPGRAGDAAALYDEAIAARNAGQPDRAIERFRQVIELEPDHVDARVQLGFSLTARRRFEEARRAFTRALEQAPDYHDARLGLARAAFFEGDLAAARRELDGLRRAAPDHAEGRALRAQVAKAETGRLIENAGALRVKGRFAEAERLLAPHLARRPADPDLLVEAGLLALVQDRHDDARRHLEVALRTRPGDLAARLGLARLDYYQARLDAAAERVEAILAAHPGNTQALALRAGIRLAGGDAPAAEEDLRRLAEAEPAVADHRLRLGDALREQWRDVEARTAYEEASRLDPASAEIRGRLALRPNARWRIDLSGGGSELGRGLDPWREGQFAAGYRLDPQQTVSGLVRTRRRYGLTDVTLQGRFDRRWGDDVSVYGALGGTPGGHFSPLALAQAGAALRLTPGAGSLGPTIGLLDLGFARYRDGSTFEGKVGLEQSFFEGRFALAGHLIGTEAAERQGGGYSLRASWVIAAPLTVSVGYASAPDISEARIVPTRTLFGSLDLALSDTVTLRLSAARERRKGNVERTDAILGLTLQF
ncbi:MAG TPA: tetratricopeptide repeat protein [Microvirga sp.]|jgi:YaiO family outer membrane protein|nr:tetratricopeptide repeat protein [Microvirga sp.]